jgi:membrane dipeptidase
MAYDAIMLQPKWVRGVTKPAITQERIVDNLDHICQLAGNCRHVGIGSDLDGGYGTEQMPTDVDTIADLQNLRPLLEKRGYSEADIASIFHGNWIRFFQEILTDSSGLA